VGNICKMESGSPGLSYLLARGEMAELIGRLADATERAGDPADAVGIEFLARQIWRELHEERPEHTPFLEAVLEHHVRIARRQGDQLLTADLRATATQAAGDLQILANRGVERELLLSLEARLALAVGVGLEKACKAESSATLALESTNWLHRSTELVETIRGETGSVPRELLEVEAAARRHLAPAEAVGR
jgi:hypothetical protein